MCVFVYLFEMLFTFWYQILAVKSFELFRCTVGYMYWGVLYSFVSELLMNLVVVLTATCVEIEPVASMPVNLAFIG